MSEPMSVVEIEDVLSSIRRLVSEDLRPTHKLVSAALHNGAAKLILTPALRVISNDQSAVADDAGERLAAPEDIEAPETEAEGDIVPMFGSVRMQEMADVKVLETTSATDANFLTSAMSRLNGLASTDTYLLQTQPETIEAVVAAVGAAVGPEEWELDGGEPAPQAGVWSDAVWNSTDETVASPPMMLTDPVVDGDAPVDHADPSAVVADAPSGELADALVPEPTEELRSVLQSPPAYVKSTFAGQDTIVFQDDLLGAAAQADAFLAASQPSAAVASTEENSSDPEEGAEFLNEDLLREIVRDMIQAELQGTLGERITRNVRKLVRAEINRALASQHYDA